MSCARIEHGFVCNMGRSFRLSLADGTRVYMAWHNYLGPIFFKDRDQNREIVEWFDNELICDALDWFIERGRRA